MDADKASPLQKKLFAQMVRRGLNGQKLAKISKVSDSEISRILAGKSRPGLENAFRLAKAVGVSLDYLADDSLETDPVKAADPLSAEEREALDLAHAIGCSRAVRILENIRIVGYEVAMRRLLDARATPEPEEPPRPQALAPGPASATVPPVQATRIS